MSMLILRPGWLIRPRLSPKLPALSSHSPARLFSLLLSPTSVNKDKSFWCSWQFVITSLPGTSESLCQACLPCLGGSQACPPSPWSCSCCPSWCPSPGPPGASPRPASSLSSFFLFNLFWRLLLQLWIWNNAISDIYMWWLRVSHSCNAGPGLRDTVSHPDLSLSRRLWRGSHCTGSLLSLSTQVLRHQSHSSMESPARCWQGTNHISPRWMKLAQKIACTSDCT